MEQDIQEHLEDIKILLGEDTFEEYKEVAERMVLRNLRTQNKAEALSL